MALLAAALAGCASGIDGLFAKDKGMGGPGLAAGVQQYEDGNYAEATRNLQAALKDGLNEKSDRVRAHKYLAFIACVSSHEGQCRSEFQTVLQLDPGFELKPSEAGHPIWGPVFRSVKSGK